jgi:16S rRNA (uracil1498-N3)-methyltransferase
MSDRFFVESPIQGNSAVLTGQDANHLAKVLRARVGQEIVLFDGSGSEFLARISVIERHGIECDILAARPVDRELVRRIWVGVALPKGDRQRVLIEKLTELGVACLTPLISERAVVQPNEQTIERLRRAVIESSKQCGRNRLLEINPPCRPAEFFHSADSSALRLIAHPAIASQQTLTLEDLARNAAKPVIIAVGPEGGFTDDEVNEAIRNGWMAVNLGPRILRVETAAMALAVVAAIAS